MTAKEHRPDLMILFRSALRFSAVPVMLYLSGCMTRGGDAPAWVDNPKAVYPESAYLAAVGEGDTRRAAENAAAANLSRIFEAHVEADERLIDQVRETGKRIDRTTDFSADINILSAQTLYNLQHAEAWTDEKGRVHAVAYLNRRETAALYRDRIDRETSHVNFLLAQAQQAGEPLLQYALLRAAAAHAADAAYLLGQLKIIHPPSVPGVTPGYSESRLRRDLAESARNIRVQIRMDGDDEGRMTAALEKWITSYGFVVGTPSILKIDGRIAMEDTGQRTADLVFIRYDLTVRVEDAEGTVLVSVSEKGREGHVSVPEARIRAFRTLENAIDAKGAHRLDTYFGSLVDHLPQP
jgi:hypothetical protein